MAVASSRAAMRTPRPTGRGGSGFTLPEVMIALLIVTGMCISAFAGMRLVSNLAMSSAVRSEANRILQARAETLMAADYSSFVSTTADHQQVAVLKTTFRPGTDAQFAAAPGSAGRVTYTWRVVQEEATSSSRRLRVEVQWPWQGRTYSVSARLFRSL